MEFHSILITTSYTAAVAQLIKLFESALVNTFAIKEKKMNKRLLEPGLSTSQSNRNNSLMGEFLKIVTRVTHLVSVSVISGVTILNYFFEATQYLAEDSNYRLVIMLMAALVTVSGIALMYQMKEGKTLEGG